ncbi:MAG: hypothetical protein CM15mP85_31250 [Rhodobacterales bacterium]|nr:MAG: hypothetical protein CM15mP85_31250 [Rhodobacterales bacterium]
MFENLPLRIKLLLFYLFIILFSFTNAYRDENLLSENRMKFLAMHPEDFLNNSAPSISICVNLITKKNYNQLHFQVISHSKRKSMRRYLNAVLESGLITKDSKYGYLL